MASAMVITPHQPSFSDVERDELIQRQEEEEANEPELHADKRQRKQAKEATENNNNDEKKTQRRKKKKNLGTASTSYEHAIYTTTKAVVGPETQLSSAYISSSNEILDALGKQISKKASVVSAHNGRETVSAKDVQAAAKLILPIQLATQAVARSEAAVKTYTKTEQAAAKKSKKSKKRKAV